MCWPALLELGAQMFRVASMEKDSFFTHVDGLAGKFGARAVTSQKSVHGIADSIARKVTKLGIHVRHAQPKDRLRAMLVIDDYAKMPDLIRAMHDEGFLAHGSVVKPRNEFGHMGVSTRGTWNGVESEIQLHTPQTLAAYHETDATYHSHRSRIAELDRLPSAERDTILRDLNRARAVWDACWSAVDDALRGTIQAAVRECMPRHEAKTTRKDMADAAGGTAEMGATHTRTTMPKKSKSMGDLMRLSELPQEWTPVKAYDDGTKTICDKVGRLGLWLPDGRVVPPQFSAVEMPRDGYVEVKLAGKWAYIVTKTGRLKHRGRTLPPDADGKYEIGNDDRRHTANDVVRERGK
jgi:hypothetical protein